MSSLLEGINTSGEIQVGNYDGRDEMSYGCSPKTEFQRFIRLSKDGNLLLLIQSSCFLSGSVSLPSSTVIKVAQNNEFFEACKIGFACLCSSKKSTGHFGLFNF